MRFNTAKGSFLLILCFPVLCVLLYSDFLSFAKTGLPVQGPDGIKNYYNYKWHVLNDSSLLHFEGMLYPHGENVVFTDNQPALSGVLWFIHQYIDLSSSVDEILFFFSVSCILLGCLMLYFTLTGLRVRWYIAFAGALMVVFTSPQFYRLTYHFGLANLAAIPFFWWMFTRFCKRGDRWKDYLIYTTGLSFFTFIHGYFIAFGGAVLLLGWLSRLALHAEKPAFVKHTLLKTVMAAAIPVLLLQAVTAMDNPVGDRPAIPKGIDDFRSKPASVFLPLGFDYFETLVDTSKIEYATEGNFFLGFVSMLGILAFLFLSFPRTRKQVSAETWQVTMHVLIISVLLLFVSLGLFHDLAEWVGIPLPSFIAQIRALGRFLYVAHIGFGVVAVYAIHCWAERLDTKRWTVLLPFFIIGFNDVRAFSKQLGEQYIIRWRFEDAQLFLNTDTYGIAASDYQAILALPFYHDGTECLPTRIYEKVEAESMRFALQTHLPLMNFALSRTSLFQALDIMRLRYLPLQKSDTVTAFPNQKPLLLIIDPGLPLTAFDQELLLHCPLLVSKNGFEYRALDLNVMEDKVRTLFEPGRFGENRSTVILRPGVSDSLFFYNPYDTGLVNKPFRGTGAFTFNGQNQTPIFDSHRDGFTLDTQRYELSFWIDLGQWNAGYLNLSMEERDSTGIVQIDVCTTWESIQALIGHWALVRYSFTPTKAGSHLLVTASTGQEKAQVTIDELLVRKTTTNVVRPDDPRFINNSYLETGN